MAGLLTFFSQGASDACQFEQGTTAPLNPCELVIPSWTELEFIGFTPGAHVDVQIERSDGTVEGRRLATDQYGFARTDWFAVPGEVPGEYRVAAVQGSRRASGTFSVQPAVRPRIMIRPDRGPPGSTFQIAFGGFTPGKPIPVHLYRQVSPLAGTATYVTNLGSTTADARGEATFTLPTRGDDAEGKYAIDTEPSSANVFTSLFQLSSRSEDDSAASRVERDGETRSAMAAVIDEANRVWAAVVGKGGPPVASLERVYAEPLLSQAQREILDMRKRGQYRDARKLRIDIQSVRELPSPRVFVAYEVIATEEWNDRLLNADGTVVRTFPSRETWRYRVELVGPWLITEATQVT